MKLATVKPKTNVKPKEGDLRIQKFFAWWPRKVENKLIWLEYYQVVCIWQVRRRILYIPGHILHDGTWGGWDVLKEQLFK